MRRTLVSTGASSRSKANARIAAAVYAPMPGNAIELRRLAGHDAAVVRDDRFGDGFQSNGARVVSQALPSANDVGCRRGGERRDVGKLLDERFEVAV